MELKRLPTEGLIRRTLDRLRNQGIGCHYGRWLIPGRPRVILLDYRARDIRTWTTTNISSGKITAYQQSPAMVK